ncbi:MAG: response regulator transcription factor [Thermoleophilia bacterium]
MTSGKVLVVDDEPGICDIVCLNLEGEGYEAECAHSGREALDKIKTEPPDLVILDIMMPEVDGWEVLSFIKGDPATSDIPVILLSAKSEEISKLLGFQLGAQDYVTKPFSVRELIARVGAALEHAKVRDEEPQASEFAYGAGKIAALKDNEVFFIDPAEIFFFAADRNNTYLHTNEDMYLVRRNLSYIETRLTKAFLRVHKSYIVNLDKVGKLSSPTRGSYLVELTDASRTKVPLSRSKVGLLRHALSGAGAVR